MRRAPIVRLLPEDRRRLVELSLRRSGRPRAALRAQIILLAAKGRENDSIAHELRTDPGTVARWRRRFLQQGYAGIAQDAPRPGRPPVVPGAKIQQVIQAISKSPSPGARFWSARRLAQTMGVSKSTVQRIWKAHAIGPVAVSGVPPPETGFGFLDRVTDLVGVYLHLPERAVAFATHSKAHSRSLEVRERNVLSRLQRRAEGGEFRAFLQVVDRETPKALDVHLLVDSRLSPVSPEVERWLSHHPRVQLHFLPSDELGLTLIDRLVGQFSRRRRARADRPSAQRLQRALREHLQARQPPAQSFVWAASADEIHGPSGRPHLQ